MVDPTPDDSGSNTDSRGGWWSWTKVLFAATALVVVVGGVWLALLSSTWDTKVVGLPDRPVTPAEVTDGSLRVHSDSPEEVRVQLDGRDVPVQVKNGSVVIKPESIEEGSHKLRVTLPSMLALGSNTITEEFVVDGTPPALKTSDSVQSKSFDAPVTISGEVADAAKVTVNGKQVEPDKSGAFKAKVEKPDAMVPVVATDRAGNSARIEVAVNVSHPGMRAVHMTGLAWTSDVLREPVLDAIRAGKIDTIELDIKDESGEIQYDSNVPLAEKIGADKGYYNARKVIDKLHSMGVRVVGRLVAFKDPILAEASWKSGHRERVVQTPSGGAYNGGYGSYAFTNFANPVVRQYNIAIAEEAAALGFDDILYDYVRRPDGDIDSMRFPGLETTPAKSIAKFLEQTREQIRKYEAYLGACVFGITVTRPESVGQNIPMMSEHLDYVAPMIYPSHWGPGEYGVANPNRQPYKIIYRSLKDWREAVQGTQTEVIPWLQDFSLGVTYGPDEVHAQIKATHDAGIDSFLLWSADARYTWAALSSQP